MVSKGPSEVLGESGRRFASLVGFGLVRLSCLEIGKAPWRHHDPANHWSERRLAHHWVERRFRLVVMKGETPAQKVIRQISELRDLARRLARAGFEAGLHKRDPDKLPWENRVAKDS